MQAFNPGFAVGDSDLVAGQVERSSPGLSAAKAVQPTGFFERLANERNISFKTAEHLETQLLQLASTIGAPQYPPAEPANGLSSSSAQCVDRPDDEVSRALDSARELNLRLDFITGLAGRIAERL